MVLIHDVVQNRLMELEKIKNEVEEKKATLDRGMTELLSLMEEIKKRMGVE